MFTVRKWFYTGDGTPYRFEDATYLTEAFANEEFDRIEIVAGGIEQVELYKDGTKIDENRVRFKDKDWDFYE